MHLAEKRHEMMLASGGKVYISFNDRLTAALGKSFAKMRFCVVAVSCGQFLKHTGDSVGSLQKPFPFGIFSDCDENVVDCFFDCFMIYSRVFHKR